MSQATLLRWLCIALTKCSLVSRLSVSLSESLWSFFLTLFFEKAVLFKIFLFAMIYEYKKVGGEKKLY